MKIGHSQPMENYYSEFYKPGNCRLFRSKEILFMCTIIGYKSLKISENTIHKALESTYSRGPDDERIQQVGCGYLGFQRLSIMGLSPEGMQPFVRNNNLVVCNGEIYGFRKLKEELEKDGYTFISQSDCEILLPLYEKYGLDMFKKLDAEYACIIYDAKKNDFVAARDPIGIRPLFYGYDKNHISYSLPKLKILFQLLNKSFPSLRDSIMPMENSLVT